MLKLIGAIMMVAATAAMGFSKIDALASRVRALEAFQGAMLTINAETTYRLTPLPELFAILSKTAQSPAREFFARCLALGGDLTETALAPVWSRALAQVRQLSPEDRRIIAQAGAILGRYDDLGQSRGLEPICEGIRESLAQARETRRSEGKVWATLGVAAGLCLVIIFI